MLNNLEIVDQLWVDYMDQQARNNWGNSDVALSNYTNMLQTSNQHPRRGEIARRHAKGNGCADKNETWIEVPKKEVQQNILSGKCVYRIKENGTYKARRVVRGSPIWMVVVRKRHKMPIFPTTDTIPTLASGLANT